MMQIPTARKNLIFATRMFEMYPANRRRYYDMAQACVQQLESQAANSGEEFAAWKIGCIALGLMQSAL
jgi:hypothetical protein